MLCGCLLSVGWTDGSTMLLTVPGRECGQTAGRAAGFREVTLTGQNPVYVGKENNALPLGSRHRKSTSRVPAGAGVRDSLAKNDIYTVSLLGPHVADLPNRARCLGFSTGARRLT